MSGFSLSEDVFSLLAVAVVFVFGMWVGWKEHALTQRYGHQPQPTGDGREGQNPPSGGSNVSPPPSIRAARFQRRWRSS